MLFCLFMLVDFNLKVPRVSVQREKHWRLQQFVDAFVHAKERIQISFVDGV